MATSQSLLVDILISSRDGDWGKDVPKPGHVPYRIIRGADFEGVRQGEASGVPRGYLKEATALKRTLMAGDILLETAGGSKGRPTGRTLFVTEELLNKFDLPVTCASFARYLRIDPSKAEPEYVYWFLQYLYESGEMWKHQVQHTGVARFQYTRFAQSVPIPLPSRPEQQRIAGILRALDNKIELNRRMNQTLEAIARALFKSWFVDFDPVRAKAEGRDTGLPKHIADLFPDRFVDSELGEIPEGWSVKPLDKVASFLNGLAMQKFPPVSGEPALPVVKIAQLKKGDTSGADLASSKLDPKYIINDGDLIFSWSGSLEVKVWAGGQGALNQHLFKVTSEGYPRWLCNLWIQKHLEDFRRIAADKAVTMGHIKRSHLSAALCAIPPDGLVQQTGALLHSLEQQSLDLSVQSKRLAEIRDCLLPKLLSGYFDKNFDSLGKEVACA